MRQDGPVVSRIDAETPQAVIDELMVTLYYLYEFTVRKPQNLFLDIYGDPVRNGCYASVNIVSR